MQYLVVNHMGGYYISNSDPEIIDYLTYDYDNDRYLINVFAEEKII